MSADDPRTWVSRRSALAAGGAVVAGLVTTTFGPSASASGAEPGAPAADAPAGPGGGFTGQVDVGGGRKLYLHYRGTSGPTVVFESGYHDNGVLWSEAEPDPPARGPAVYARLAGAYGVCSYDRPGTLDYSTQPPVITTRSTPAPMPRSAAAVVADLHTALRVARVPEPYVLVAHSLGGLFARLYAQTHPDQVLALVLVDTFGTTVPALMGSAWPAYRRLLARPGVPGDTDPRWEVIDIDRSIAQIAAAPPLRSGMPVVVLSKTEPFALPPGDLGFTSAQLERVWQQAQDQLPALAPNTPHLIATGSDHYVQVRQPDLVSAATRLVITRAGPPGSDVV